MERSCKKGAPPLNAEEYLRNLELLTEHDRLIKQILDQLEVSMARRPSLIQVITPLSTEVVNQDGSEVQFKIPPFQIYLFVASFEQVNGKINFNGLALVVGANGQAAFCDLSMTGKSSSLYNISVDLDEHRRIVINSHEQGKVTVNLGDYREIYNIDCYIYKTILENVLVLRELKAKLDQNA